MTILSPTGATSVKSMATPEDLAHALQALHLDKMPPQNRWPAIRERLAMVMLSTVKDPAEKEKEHYRKTKDAYFKSRGVILASR